MNPIEKPVFLEIKLVLIIAHNSIKSMNYLLPLPCTRAVSLFRIQIRLPFACLRTPLGPIPVSIPVYHLDPCARPTTKPHRTRV